MTTQLDTTAPPLDGLDLDGLAALAEKATPPPLYISGRLGDGATFFGDSHWNVRSSEPSDPERGPHVTTSGVHSEADAAYIVALVNAAPRLIAAARLGEAGLDKERLTKAMRAVLDTTTRERVLPYADKLAAEYQTLATALSEAPE